MPCRGRGTANQDLSTLTIVRQFGECCVLSWCGLIVVKLPIPIISHCNVNCAIDLRCLYVFCKWCSNVPYLCEGSKSTPGHLTLGGIHANADQADRSRNEGGTFELLRAKAHTKQDTVMVSFSSRTPSITPRRFPERIPTQGLAARMVSQSLRPMDCHSNRKYIERTPITCWHEGWAFRTNRSYRKQLDA
jgi:hypothetical protein